jgi:hypothetical protein
MIIILKILTILIALVLLWIASAVVLYVPLRVQLRYKKVFLFSASLSISILVIGGLMFLGAVDGPGILLVPIVVVGTALSCFLVFGFYALMIKRFSLTNKSVKWTSLTATLLILIVLSITLPINYAYDKETVAAYNEHEIPDCANMEYGWKMFMTEERRTYDGEKCYRDIAIASGNEDFCDKIIDTDSSVQTSDDCRNNVKIISAISKELCSADYDTKCFLEKCRYLRGAYQYGERLAKEDPKWCDIFGEQGKHMEPCR